MALAELASLTDGELVPRAIAAAVGVREQPGEPLLTTVGTALRATRHLGRFCVIGFASGPIASVPLNQVLLNNRTVVGVDWGGWTFKDPLGNRDLIAQLMEMVGAGRLHPVEPAAFPLEQAAAVMTGLIDRSIGGKAVLVP